MCGRAKSRAITRRCGSSLRKPEPLRAAGGLLSGIRLGVVSDQVVRNWIESGETPVDWDMHPPGYYREQARREERTSELKPQFQITYRLQRVTKNFEDIACDL